MKKLAVALAILVPFVSCKKEQHESCAYKAGTIQAETGGKQKVEQKMFDVNKNQALEIVQKFKAGIANSDIAQGRLIDADSVRLDSSVFVMEAALNYDFDHIIPDTASMPLKPDTSEYTIPITRRDLMVSSDDLEEVYKELSTFIGDKITSSSKVKVVDLDAYVVGNQVYYRAVVIRANYYPILVDCVPLSQIEAADGMCFPNSADFKVTYKLNNCKFIPCPSTWYFNVYTNQTSNLTNSYPNILYYNYPTNTCDYTGLSPLQLNGYISNIYNYINSGLPVGYRVTNCYVYTGKAYLNLSSASTFWTLDVTYGQTYVSGC